MVLKTYKLIGLFQNPKPHQRAGKAAGLARGGEPEARSAIGEGGGPAQQGAPLKIS